MQVFLPRKGKYILEIYMMSNKVAANIFNVVAIYQLNCCSRSQAQLNLKEVDIKPPFPNVSTFNNCTNRVLKEILQFFYRREFLFLLYKRYICK